MFGVAVQQPIELGGYNEAIHPTSSARMNNVADGWVHEHMARDDPCISNHLSEFSLGYFVEHLSCDLNIELISEYPTGLSSVPSHSNRST